jgi:hypothetical protein
MKTHLLLLNEAEHEQCENNPLIGASKRISHERLFHNFLLFSISFSLVHATVDGVLVYATAELVSN